MPRLRVRLPAVSALLLIPLLPGRLRAQSTGMEELRAAILQYREALKRSDVAALEQFWAPEYSMVTPRGHRATRAERLAGMRAGHTAVDSLAPVPGEERIQTYGDQDPVAVQTTLLTIGGRYRGREERGQYRAIAVWVRRGGRWQQVTSQLTPVE